MKFLCKKIFLIATSVLIITYIISMILVIYTLESSDIVVEIIFSFMSLGVGFLMVLSPVKLNNLIRVSKFVGKFAMAAIVMTLFYAIIFSTIDKDAGILLTMVGLANGMYFGARTAGVWDKKD